MMTTTAFNATCHCARVWCIKNLYIKILHRGRTWTVDRSWSTWAPLTSSAVLLSRSSAVSTTCGACDRFAVPASEPWTRPSWACASDLRPPANTCARYLSLSSRPVPVPRSDNRPAVLIGSGIRANSESLTLKSSARKRMPLVCGAISTTIQCIKVSRYDFFPISDKPIFVTDRKPIRYLN